MKPPLLREPGQWDRCRLKSQYLLNSLIEMQSATALEGTETAYVYAGDWSILSREIVGNAGLCGQPGVYRV